MKMPPPFNDSSEKNIHVIVETPKGSRYKYAYEPEQELFLLKRILPTGMGFPLNFGFVPNTLAEDGDALDALLITSEPVAVGALVICRVLGVMELLQTDDSNGASFRNDRLICVPEYYAEFNHLHTLQDLGQEWLHDLLRFFDFYRTRVGGSITHLANRGPEAALKTIHRALKMAESHGQSTGK